ncbi:MAG: hypothetical protein IKV29_06525 [Alistipes sp.]|nr:hypothetical protein [Alistipes sp.]
MKKLFTLLCAFAAATPLMAQTEEGYQEAYEAVETASEMSLGQTILTIFVAVVILAASLAMLAHMIYDNFIRKPYNEERKAEDYVQARRDAGLVEESTDEEIAYINGRLDEVIAAWGSIPGDDGEPIPYPLKKSGVKLAREVMAEVEAAMPTDADTVERMNAFSGIMNNALERSFNGSKALIITSVIVGVVFAIIASPSFAVTIGVGLAIYWLASRTSNFVLVRQELKGKGGKQSFLTRVIGGLFAGIAAAKTYEIVTTYSDGSETRETDNSETWISLAFTLIVIVVLAVFIWVFSLVNYLRNYVLYF